jgi:hypothetical protein
LGVSIFGDGPGRGCNASPGLIEIALDPENVLGEVFAGGKHRQWRLVAGW